MSIPGRPCRYCGELPAVTYHLDGSYASASHNCRQGPPGPPDLPRRIPRGQYVPVDPHERETGALKAEVAMLRSQVRGLRKQAFEALGMKLPESQDFALAITEAERAFRDLQRGHLESDEENTR